MLASALLEKTFLSSCEANKSFSMNYLLDTCTISDFFKKVPSVISRFEQLSPVQIHISAITVMEIEYGLKLHSERELKIRPVWTSLLAFIRVLPFSENCAAESALFRQKLKTAGTPVGPYDLLVAGTAAANKLTLVPSNLSEFRRFSGLAIENWR